MYLTDTLHSQAIKVEDSDWTSSVPHSREERADSLGVVLCGEARGEVETVRPGRWDRWHTCQSDIVLQSRFHRAPSDQVVLQLFTSDADSHPGALLPADLDVDLLAVVDKHTVTLAGEVERNVLVSQLGACSTVRVPDLVVLSVLDQRAESLSETVDCLADAQTELVEHVSDPTAAAVVLSRRFAVGVLDRTVVRGHVGGVCGRGLGEVSRHIDPGLALFADIADFTQVGVVKDEAVAVRGGVEGDRGGSRGELDVVAVGSTDRGLGLGWRSIGVELEFWAFGSQALRDG